ncbi:PTS lactose/cellobiose transporter subunit IIA [Lacticaseibacillus pantheris]|jgi:PTS system cellobiose-specific IIA component|uniref:PTS lactose/cellobiose transporter subunit IIA n=1 Tax=Lacticaseibacillus pantheris TaxID=171523 RepID=UPI00259721D2|nr:PTS lactose/cellobiose transporter subunit IIA [Lacticaseibacillus pantheris]WKF85889.1 PTS lactose/cellobiose transporter subunit IIA [Lacticaseibacillus pantheris]
MTLEEQNQKSIKDTMDIIINAGDARAFISEALDAVAEFNYSVAKQKMKVAEEKLTVAHRLQTKKLQQEAEGDDIQYSVLFTHAQDTLMTIKTEFNLTNKLITVFEKRDQQKR